MFNPKIIFPLFILIFLGEISFAQSDTINQKDSLGLKQGYWIVYGKDMPEKNYPADGKIEEGNYKDDKKNGIWIFYHIDGMTPRTTGTFENGRPNGPYVKYFEHTGKIKESGCHTNGKQTGYHRVYFESGCLAVEKFYNQGGKEDGTVTWYFDNCDSTIDTTGTVENTYRKLNGISVGPFWRYYECGDVKESGEYDVLGNKKYSNAFMNSCGPQDSISPYACEHIGPKYSETFNGSGYHKLYNKNDDLFMEGTFKDGRLCCGKLYEYDSDGILLSIEIWRGGECDTLPKKYDCHGNEIREVIMLPLALNEIDSADICNPQDWTIPQNQKSPFALGGSMIYGSAFRPNDFNHVYVGYHQLWLSGEFKNGHLWNGKQYIYDDEGNEIRIEIWKRGKYRRDEKIETQSD